LHQNVPVTGNRVDFETAIKIFLVIRLCSVYSILKYHICLIVDSSFSCLQNVDYFLLNKTGMKTQRCGKWIVSQWLRAKCLKQKLPYRMKITAKENDINDIS